MSRDVEPDEVFGLLRPSVDAHTLGISYVARLLREVGNTVVIADRLVTDAANAMRHGADVECIRRWIREHRISRLGVSYRLDPVQALDLFTRLRYQLIEWGLLSGSRNHLRALYFAGLPEACARVEQAFGREVRVFRGDETPAETLRSLGIPEHRIPAQLVQESGYDEERMAFGHALVRERRYLSVRPEDRSGYSGFGTRRDSVLSRVDHAARLGQAPLMRVHVGPYQPQRMRAVTEFLDWTRTLSRTGFLDIVSIGTSQLTQERFGEVWGETPNGGGVPINSEEEYAAVWAASRPLLVRTYAGTKNIPSLARVYERSINNAWHALSFWWFSRIDGRGPNPVRQNLQEHLETLRYVAHVDKPFEPNIPHHFAFRGGDDVTYVLSALLAIQTAKHLGVRSIVLQIMLNTPKYTLGLQDLAKARALLTLARELEDHRFRVLLQPRAGLDYFSPDLERSRAQLASVSALMDDIEPLQPNSPQIIHVVSFPEASHLATPLEIDESIQITRAALTQYRSLRRLGRVPHMGKNRDVDERTMSLVEDVRFMVRAIHDSIPSPYSAGGLYLAMASGFLVAPHLWEEREEFQGATRWKTDVIDGGVKVVDEMGKPVSIKQRAAECADLARQLVSRDHHPRTLS